MTWKEIKLFLSTFFYYFQSFLFAGLILLFSHQLIFDRDRPILHARIFNDDFGGHTLVWLSVFIFGFYANLINRRGLVLSLLAIFMIEGIWQISFYSISGNIPASKLGLIELMSAISINLLTKSWRYFEGRKLLYTLGLIILTHFVWVVSGFPITMDTRILDGYTEFYRNDFVNFIEVTQWQVGLSLLALSLKVKEV